MMHCETSSVGYTRLELYEMWLGFRENEHADKILSDFAVCSRREAQEMIDGFELSLEAQMLGTENRGKKERVL